MSFKIFIPAIIIFLLTTARGLQTKSLFIAFVEYIAVASIFIFAFNSIKILKKALLESRHFNNIKIFMILGNVLYVPVIFDFCVGSFYLYEESFVAIRVKCTTSRGNLKLTVKRDVENNKACLKEQGNSDVFHISIDELNSTPVGGRVVVSISGPQSLILSNGAYITSLKIR